MELKRDYDLIVIMNPELTIEEAKEKMDIIFKELNIEIKKSEILGRKELQYERKKFKSGLFLEYTLSFEPEKSSDLQYRLNIDSYVLQYFLKNLLKK